MSAQTTITTTGKTASAVPMFRPQLEVVDIAARKSNCAHCRLNAICIPDSLSPSEREEFTSLIFQHRRLPAGQSLYRTGDTFDHLYFIKTGAMKTLTLLPDGREQVTGFHIAGDTVGIDAIGSSAHPSEAVALEDTWVCAIPYASLMKLSRRAEHVQIYLHRLLSRELVRDQGVMLLLGRMQAEERVAAFLLGMSQRFKANGLSPRRFTLPMVREEIGNYLGLTLETVSRCFSRLKKASLIAVENREVEILDAEKLAQVIGRQEHAK